MGWRKNPPDLNLSLFLKIVRQTSYLLHVSICVYTGRDGNPELKKRVKDCDVIFRVNNSEIFYFVNNNELRTRGDLIV